MLKLDSLKIEGIGGIRNLTLDFGPGLNLICGPNGIGKTTILECIAHSFASGFTSVLRRHVQVEQGSFSVTFTTEDNQQRQVRSQRAKYHPREGNETSDGGPFRYLQDVIVFKTHRDFAYVPLDAINRDPDLDWGHFSDFALRGSQAQDLKSWFLNRYIWSAHASHLRSEQLDNLELAKACFGMLDAKVSFGGVVPDTHDILVKTPDGDIYFEYLSSGYRSCLYVLLGLVKEVEYRFKAPYIRVNEFSGVVLIDELDLHLHPEWQARLLMALKRILPNAQIVATTHSPHMIQVADPNEIIALGFGEHGSVVVRDIPQTQFGYQGWTIEEILQDVMGLSELRSEVYRMTLAKFETALDQEDVGSATEAYEILTQMLHPTSLMRKLLRIQLAALGGPRS